MVIVVIVPFPKWSKIFGSTENKMAENIWRLLFEWIRPFRWSSSLSTRSRTHTEVSKQYRFLLSNSHSYCHTVTPASIQRFLHYEIAANSFTSMSLWCAAGAPQVFSYWINAQQKCSLICSSFTWRRNRVNKLKHYIWREYMAYITPGTGGVISTVMVAIVISGSGYTHARICRFSCGWFIVLLR